MSTKLISMAALFGVAAFACPGIDHQYQKRADGAISMSSHPSPTLTDTL
jgi:hypothetical protein